MKKLIYSLPASLFEIFVVEFNGYGFEILNRDENEVVFAIYAQNEEVEGIKNSINEIFEDLGGGTLILEEDITEENWEEKWKENFQPIRIPPFIIIPEWEVYTGNDLIPIKIKPGMAFGTGLHPTTQIMLRLIPEYVNKGEYILDIGTGSGILAIAAAKIGAFVDAIDIQEEAVEECQQNAWENEVKINCQKKSVEEIDKKYDTVLANLQIDIFRKHFKTIASLFNRYLIISGIFKEKEKTDILKMADKSKLIPVKELSQPEEGKEGELWYGFVFRHK
ncbi:[LSU ribosomal protein L11P]-lysine N-methyltransferase [Persephonella hydrogeniphila]|uniref:Ribosomal protein L11 methyltransferase n=1 Tax=Persephonella hydrogeniphila TaxID=198703 RepID=A0A285NBD6_9AQUI|nr:50S ribosomal protein L11 methyltransferase [Persephonella hydrogeniphila]SNZ06775.1 [LSU ribosomal protein L11P]-lysine N-methyltransferase [Persephonella hydrogeniphila]